MGDLKDETIFVTGVVGRAMGSGQFPAQAIHTLVDAAQEAWRAYYGQPGDTRIPKLTPASSAPEPARDAEGREMYGGPVHGVPVLNSGPRPTIAGVDYDPDPLWNSNRNSDIPPAVPGEWMDKPMKYGKKVCGPVGKPWNECTWLEIIDKLILGQHDEEIGYLTWLVERKTEEGKWTKANKARCARAKHVLNCIAAKTPFP